MRGFLRWTGCLPHQSRSLSGDKRPPRGSWRLPAIYGNCGLAGPRIRTSVQWSLAESVPPRDPESPWMRVGDWCRPIASSRAPDWLLILGYSTICFVFCKTVRRSAQCRKNIAEKVLNVLQTILWCHVATNTEHLLVGNSVWNVPSRNNDSSYSVFVAKLQSGLTMWTSLRKGLSCNVYLPIIQWLTNFNCTPIEFCSSTKWVGMTWWHHTIDLLSAALDTNVPRVG